MRVSYVVSICFILTSSPVSGEVLFDGTFTGAEMDALVDSGDATYPTTRTVATMGSRLDFGVGTEYGEIIYRLPIAAPKLNRSGLMVNLTLDWELVALGIGEDPQDNDISVGVSDGLRIIAVKASNQGRVEIYHADDVGVAPNRNALPSVAFPFASPWTNEFSFGASQDVTTSTANGSTNLSLSVPFDQTCELEVLLLADDALNGMASSLSWCTQLRFRSRGASRPRCRQLRLERHPNAADEVDERRADKWLYPRRFHGFFVAGDSPSAIGITRERTRSELHRADNSDGADSIMTDYSAA